MRLLVIGEQKFSSHPLPDEGRLTIGSSPSCDICVADASLAPVHAAIIAGNPLRIEDLGSPGGTRVREVRIAAGQTVALAAGDLVHLGSALLTLDSRRLQPRRRILTHGMFEVRVEEECLRAERFGTPFSVLAASCRPAQQADAPAELIEAVLASSLRAIDVVACYGPGEYEVLLCDTPGGNVHLVTERLRQRLGERGVEARTGFASYPRDAQGPDALLERARATVGGATRAQVEVEVEIEQPGAAVQNLFRMVDRVAASEISVVIFGETGVGKELFAQRVHRGSKRADKPLLSINCAALSESLLESELFGHERGAFTSAHRAKAGLLENAAGGSVFLDEVGDMPAAIQAKLLRVLEERKARRVGGLESYDIDVRFISATNRDLEREIERGTFRKDLFFRLDGISFTIPPLRERQDEIAQLARVLLAESCRRSGAAVPALSPEVEDVLRSYSWPGNVRELRNVMERALVLCGQSPISLAHLPMEKMTAHFAARAPGSRPPARAQALPDLQFVAPTSPVTAPPGQDLRGAVQAFERQRIVDALAETGGNQARAAKLLNISRRTLVKRLSEYEIPRPRKPGRAKAAG